MQVLQGMSQTHLQYIFILGILNICVGCVVYLGIFNTMFIFFFEKRNYRC
jgi:hypothetical protein